MGGMNLAGSYGAAGGADALKELLKQRFIEGQARIRAQEAQQQFAQNQQRIDNDASQFGVTSGLARDKFGEDTRQFDVTSGQAGERIGMDKELQPVRIAQMGAQTADLNRQPQEALDARAFTEKMAGIQNTNELGQIGARTAGAVKVAGMRQPTGLSPNQQMTQTRALQGSYNKIVAPSRDMQRQLQAMDIGLAEAQKGNLNAGSQAVLMTFQKILDPSSVVRETEYDRTPQGMGLMQQIQGILPRLAQGGPGVPPAELAKFADLARQITEGATASAQTNAKGLLDLATANGIDPRLITGGDGSPTGEARSTGTSGGGPKVGEIKTFANGRKGKWDGTGWEPQ